MVISRLRTGDKTRNTGIEDADFMGKRAMVTRQRSLLRKAILQG
jgi:hypothetical protein